MLYKPNKDSIKSHKVPDWYHDAKLGIFIHWGLYSVPAFAPYGINYIESIKRGYNIHFRNNPYAEWYLNSLRITGSTTQKHHIKTYGKDFSYENFASIFNNEIQKWNPEEWAELFKKAGANYVVLVTKHHDGFLLWPSKYRNPEKENYIASRDIVGELTYAVKSRGLKMGFYYSGCLDWSFNSEAIKDAKSLINNMVKTEEYIKYANNHWYELIEQYEPVILWNDIGYPPTNLYKLFAYFYNKCPDGVINDRWNQIREKDKNFPKVRHYDFLTLEYQIFKKFKKNKWETNRGIGNSYGYNQFETEDLYLSSEKLIRMFIDIVSKNGNLLLNVGPMPDGTIPEIQKTRLLNLGKWLDINGDAIYETRPWIKAEGKTLNSIEVRFTQNNNNLYAIILGKPKSDSVIIQSLVIDNKATINLVGHVDSLEWNQLGKNLKIIFPKKFSNSAAFAFRITPKPKN